VKRLACIILIITILVSGLAFVRTGVHAATVGGNITTNTEWTTNDSPVILNGSIRLTANATLIIDPGVTVNFGNSYYSIDIGGTLVAIGTPDNPITFTIPDNQTNGRSIFFEPSSPGWSDATNSGSIIQYANFNKIYVYTSSSLKIDNCNFNFAVPQSPIIISGGSPTISNNKIVFTGQDPSHYCYGISVQSGTPTITNNEFDGNGQLTGINAQSSNPFTISNNIFSKCWIGVKAPTTVVLTVQGNQFLGCNDGLDINEVARLTISGNLIDSCIRYGINGGGVIESNTITNNQIGIHNPSTGSVINDNNIVGNIGNSVTTGAASVDAQNNWWGISDAWTINQTIYDFYDDSSLGKINFVPFLNGPDPSAPAIPISTPTITPIPTAKPVQTTVQPTVEPTIQPPTLEPTPTQKSEPILNDTSDLLNLNLFTGIVVTLLALVWIVVILGYVAKSGISKYKAKNKSS